jgi:hypothetical protein
MSLWSNFWQEVEIFFSDVGTTFLSSIKAAFPVLEQAAMNFLVAIADAIVAAIESGAIPLPVLAADPGTPVDSLAVGEQKRKAAFVAIQAKLAETPPPAGMTVSTSLINSAIEISVQKYKVANSGNHGNFPGGNSGPVSA